MRRGQGWVTAMLHGSLGIILSTYYAILSPYPGVQLNLFTYSHTWPYADTRPYTRIELDQFDMFRSWDLAIYRFDMSPNEWYVNQKTWLRRCLRRLNCPALTSMKVITFCRQWHRQPHAQLQSSDLRPRLMMTRTPSMNSVIKETKTAWSTMIFMISIPKLIMRII